MKVRYASHCSYRIRYHMVFVLKYRKDLISDLVFSELKDILEGISFRYHLSFQAVGTDKNHLHLLVESAPRYSPSKVIQICKSVTAVQLFKRIPELKDILWGGHFWSEGGHIDTVGDGYDVKQMAEYILNQGVSRKQVTLTSFSSTDVDDYIYFQDMFFENIFPKFLKFVFNSMFYIVYGDNH